MNSMGPIFSEVERGPSRRDFWFAAFLAALHRLPTGEALAEADAALVKCNAKWQGAPVISDARYRDSYPVGARLPLSPSNKDE